MSLTFSSARATLARSLVATLLLALAGGTVRAQSLNIDIQTGAGSGNDVLPLNTFGGVPNQYGVWNDWRPPTFTQPMRAIDGAQTPVLMSMALSATTQFANVIFSGNSPDPFLNDLISDLVEVHFLESGQSITFTLSGLTSGTYDVFTYAGLWNCGHPNTVSIVTPGSIDPPQAVAGVARHRVTVSGGTIQVRVDAAQAPCLAGYTADCEGLQLVKLGEATAICAGDGTGTSCPCANSGGAGRGCATSFEPLGALLSGSGSASVAADSLVLTGSGVSNAAATYFRGSAAFGNGGGIVFADGLLCSGGTIARLVTRAASGNQVSYPGVGDTPLSTLAGQETVGAERIYQVWYRDAAPGFCTSATFNLTNGVRTVWAP